MWFEVIPSMIIVGASVVIPQFVAQGLNILVLGNPMRRRLEEMWDRMMLTRDIRLCPKAPFKLVGLENIPDA